MDEVAYLRFGRIVVDHKRSAFAAPRLGRGATASAIEGDGRDPGDSTTDRSAPRRTRPTGRERPIAQQRSERVDGALHRRHHGPQPGPR